MRPANPSCVRYHFPAELAELAGMLSTDCKTRDISSALSVPLTTVYRWLSLKRSPAMNVPTGWTKSSNADVARYLDRLFDACEKSGFDVRLKTTRIIPRVFGDSIYAYRGFVRNGPYDFLSELPNQIVVGQFTFPRGALNGVETDLDVMNFANGTLSPSVKSQVLLAKMEIDQHYYTRLSCDSLAQLVGMTKYNFIRSFKVAFGASPYQYLSKVRVDHARHMLALSKQPLAIIAAGVGFSSKSSLARAFKRFAGASPGKVIPKLAPASAASRISPRSLDAVVEITRTRKYA